MKAKNRERCESNTNASSNAAIQSGTPLKSPLKNKGDDYYDRVSPLKTRGTIITIGFPP